MNAEPPEERSAADERLDQHFDLLRADTPQGSTELTRRVVQRARWQRALRAPLRAVASLLGAAFHGVAGLAGMRGRGR